MPTDAAAVSYYRQHRRAIEALAASKCFGKSSGRADTSTFLGKNADLQELTRRTETFNSFSALGVAEMEIRHSRFLAWLLDPKGSHGQGEAFLRKFIGDPEIAKDDFKTPAFGTLEATEVTCESDQIDILLVNRSCRFVCAIENKVRIAQGEGQLTRYRKAVEAEYAGWTCKFIFLTLNGEKPADARYIPLSYAHILKALGNLVPTKAHDAAALALLFRDYSELISGSGTPANRANVLEILHLARTELKHSHFLTWLLNPKGSHRLGDAFARFVLATLVAKGVRLPAAAKNLDLTDAVVRREIGRIDILLVSERHRFVLAIENKIWSGESKTQLTDYEHFLQRHFAGDHLVRVFLDLKGRAASHPDYVPLSYQDLLPFFQKHAERSDEALTSAENTGVLIRQYAALLTDHLWIKRKTQWELPEAIQACCNRISTRNDDAAATVLRSVTEWQKDMGRNLEMFLYATADRYFGKSYQFTWDVWFSFVPPIFDSIPALRNGGADPAFRGRLLMYQFFVIPFGDSGTVRRPGIFLDVKLVKARPDHEGVKAQLHDAALLNPIFNRAKRTQKLAKFDILLNHEICAFEEAVTCDDPELRRRIANRVERFSRSIHPEIVGFFSQQLAPKPARSARKTTNGGS